MNGDEIRRASQNSERVRRVAAAAIRYSAFRILKHPLSDEEARRLALCFTPSEVVRKLEERLRIRRHVPGSEDHKLATLEVTADGLRRLGNVKDLPVEELSDENLGILEGVRKNELLRDVFEASDKHQQRLSAEFQLEERLADLRRRTKASSYELNRFIRRVRRLWSRQRNEITQKIFDPKHRAPAFEELTEFYSNYLKEALDIELEYVRDK